MRRTSRVMECVLAAMCPVLAGFHQGAACAADVTPPTGTILINDNRSATNRSTVTLRLAWDDGAGGSGVVRMRFSDDGATWSGWGPLSATRSYTLPGADGYKTVRVQYLDKANNHSIIYSDFIHLDKTAPTGSILINGGDVATPSPEVMLGLAWADGAGAGVTRMRFSDNGSNWSAWEPVKSLRAHTIPLPNGYHTVRVQYADGAGNYSPVYSDYIKLEMVPDQDMVILPGGVVMEMVWVPGGTCNMGSPDTEAERHAWEGPQHAVAVKGFWMGKYELTQRQWQAVMGTTPWSGREGVLADLESPATYVSWNDAQSFLVKLGRHTGGTYRLPPEAAWEYACRATTQTRFYWGDDPGYYFINGYAWWTGNAYSPGETYAHETGQMTPNLFGLYDMSGNVWEWCRDCWHSDYTGAPVDGSGWEAPSTPNRVIRGGSWRGAGDACRSACRESSDPDDATCGMGFRVCR